MFDFSINLEVLLMFYLPNIWDQFSIFYSTPSSQSFLKKAYTKRNIQDAEIKSFDNCYTFIYYLEQAKTYYDQSKISPISIQPILLFYGFVQLLKACVLTINPDYPESTAILAHGVSTRKRKKQHYEFLKDEIKIQKNGLFTHMAEKMFHMKHLEGERITMSDLMGQVPEINPVFRFLTSSNHWIPISKNGIDHNLDHKVLDIFHMSLERFSTFLEEKINVDISSLKNSDNTLSFQTRKKISYNHSGPIKYNLLTQHFYLSLDKNNSCFTFPELLIHYLLLYNLSMIARYEIEWWYDVLKNMASNDYPFIQQFLTHSIHKGPYLIYTWLHEQFDDLNF
jgi:hypothetical protein